MFILCLLNAISDFCNILKNNKNVDYYHCCRCCLDNVWISRRDFQEGCSLPRLFLQEPCCRKQHLQNFADILNPAISFLEAVDDSLAFTIRAAWGGKLDFLCNLKEVLKTSLSFPKAFRNYSALARINCPFNWNYFNLI